MNTYEVLTIFKPSMDVDGMEAMLTQFQTNAVEGNGGQIIDSDRLGRKRLAYDIRKFKDGFIAIFLIKFPPQNVVAFRQACQYTDDLLRVTLVRRDDLTQLKRTAFREGEGEQRGGPGGGRFGDRDRGGRGGPGGGRFGDRDRGGFRGGPGGGPRGPRPDFRGPGPQGQPQPAGVQAPAAPAVIESPVSAEEDSDD